MTEDQKLEIGLFWYGIIHPYMDERLAKGEKAALRSKIISQEHNIPYSNKKSIGERTFFTYLKRYREGGFEAMLPSSRKDSGTIKAITDDVLKKALEYKRELPTRSVREIIDMLEMSGNIEKDGVKGSTLSRIMSSTIGGLAPLSNETHKTLRRFQKENVNDTWQSDIKYCIYIRDPKNPKEYVRTYLVCFLDDRSRKVCGKIYLEENAANVEDCFRKALIRMGIPGTFYTDNAKVYKTRRLKVICAELGSHLKYCKPYSPSSKGKVEKFNSYVDRSFEPEARKLGIETIEELNEYFEYWLSENYNNKVHGELRATPDAVHCAAKKLTKSISPEKLREVFIQRQERKADKTGTISLIGNLYKVEGFLSGKKIEARFDPKDPAIIEIYHNGQRYKDAEPLIIRENVWDSAEGTTIQPSAETETDVKTSYLKLLKEKYEKKLSDKANKINYSNLYNEDGEADV